MSNAVANKGLLWTATHKGDLPGFPATGNQIRMSGATVYYFEAGRLNGHWQITDRLGVFMQLRQGLASAYFVEFS